MKKIFAIIAIMFCSLAYSQGNPVLDSIQIYNPMPKGNLIETIYDGQYFYKALDRLGEREKSDTFIVKFYFKECPDCPQRTDVRPFSKVKFIRKEPVKAPQNKT